MSLLLDASAGEFAGATIRKTNETPPCVDVFDLIQAIETDKSKTYAANKWQDLLKIPEIRDCVHRYHHTGQERGRGSWVTNAQGVVLIVQCLSGMFHNMFHNTPKHECRFLVVPGPCFG